MNRVDQMEEEKKGQKKEMGLSDKRK